MSDLKQLEEQLANAREIVQMRDRMERLCSNPDFKELILKDFCVENCARAIKVSADFTVPKEQREDSIRLAQSAGYLEIYIQKLCQFGQQAEADIPNLIEQIEMVRVEEQA